MNLRDPESKGTWRPASGGNHNFITDYVVLMPVFSTFLINPYMYMGLESYGLILIHIYPYLEKYYKLPSSLQHTCSDNS